GKGVLLAGILLSAAVRDKEEPLLQARDVRALARRARVDELRPDRVQVVSERRIAKHFDHSSKREKGVALALVARFPESEHVIVIRLRLPFVLEAQNVADKQTLVEGERVAQRGIFLWPRPART